MKAFKYSALFLLLLTGCFIIPSPSQAEAPLGPTKGQTVYVPAYSYIYSGIKEKPFSLTITLSIRNIDPTHPIQITAIDYHESQGTHLKKILEMPVILNALGAMRYVISEKDKSGGSGANFVVKWISDQPVNAPIIESIMIGTQSGQGISFTSRGKALTTQP